MTQTVKQTKKPNTNKSKTDANLETPPENKSTFGQNADSVVKPFIVGYNRRIAFFPCFLSISHEAAILKTVKRAYETGEKYAFFAKRDVLVTSLKAAPRVIPDNIKNPKIADYPPNDADIKQTVEEIFSEYDELDDRLLTAALDLIITMSQPVASFG